MNIEVTDSELSRIIAAMNFTRNRTQGTSWEAGDESIYKFLCYRSNPQRVNWQREADQINREKVDDLLRSRRY